jgi:hypothetical protein
MAAWPDTAELKRLLAVTGTDLDDTLDRVMAAAIAQTKTMTGGWDEGSDIPDDSLAAAALRLAELLALRPDAAAQAVADPTYQRLLYGHHTAFGIA